MGVNSREPNSESGAREEHGENEDFDAPADDPQASDEVAGSPGVPAAQEDATAESAEEQAGSDPAATASSTPLAPVVVSESSVPLPASEGASALTAYMAQLRHHAPITREEEHELAVRWVEEGDVEAARQMVLSNLRLVVKIAMEYRRAWTNTLDLIQEGNVGLMEAVQRYDPYQGVKLSSYAVYWIRAYILKYILDNMRSVRLGTTRASRKLFFRLNKEKRQLESEGFEVEPKLLAERLEVPEEEVVQMEQQLARPDVYIDAPLRRDGEGTATYGDFMTGGEESAEEQVGSGELLRVFREHIAEFSQGLDPRAMQILEERVLAPEPKTLADLGEVFGVSRERVRQLEVRLVDQLRSYMQENMVDFDYYAPEAEEDAP